MGLPVPNPATAVAGVDISAAYWNAQVRDSLNYLLTPPFARIYQHTPQTGLAASTWYPMNMDVTVVDAYGGHSNVTNNSRYTAQAQGWYEVSGGAAGYAGAANFQLQSVIDVNGVAQPGTHGQFTTSISGGVVWAPIEPTPIFLNVGDYVQIFANGSLAWQTYVGGITTDAFNSRMTVKWISS